MRWTRVQDLSHSSALTSGPRDETRSAYSLRMASRQREFSSAGPFEVKTGLQDAHSFPDPHLVMDLWVAVVELDQRTNGSGHTWGA